MAWSMPVITTLVGNCELGQEVYIGLTWADSGSDIITGERLPRKLPMQPLYDPQMHKMKC